MSNIDKQIADLDRAIRDAMGSALFDVGNVTIATAEPFVPIHTGALRRSARVKVDKQKLQVTVNYGGGDVDYAGPQYGPPFSADFAKRHLTRGDTLVPVTNILPEKKKKSQAPGKGARYSRAYAEAVRKDVLTVFKDGAQWIEKAIETKNYERKVLSIIRGAFR